MISLKDLTLMRGSRPLLEHVDLTLFTKQRIGLVGPNGCGKSSLFALLRGEIDPAGGEVSLPQNCQISSVAQETPALPITAIDFVLQGDKTVYDLQLQMAAAEATNDYDKVAQLHIAFGEADGYTANARAHQLLDGLGFTTEQCQQTVADFSGGWRMRLNLAQALMCPCDLLLLDEPTNHLDLETIFWLERYLKQLTSTIIIIAHDREFLDNVVNEIAHIDNQSIKLYRGDYSSFEEQRAAQLALQQATYEKQQKKLKHMQSYVDRFRYKASKARQAQSRLKAIDRMEKVAAIHLRSPLTFEFFRPERLPSPMITIREGEFGYGGEPILKNVHLQIGAGDRIGLLGFNGAGKSTLIKGLLGKLPEQGGKRIVADKLPIGYFDQHQMDALDPQDTPLATLQRLDPKITPQVGRNYLGGFAFSGDMALTKVGVLSGGERARLALALLIWKKPALLLLDEPTNHLDLEIRESLDIALQSYEGAMVVISHDRHLLRTTVDELYLVHDGLVEVFKGDLDDYQKQTAALKKLDASDAKSIKPSKEKSKPAQKINLAALEKKIARISDKLDAVNLKLGDADIYLVENQEKCTKLQQEQQTLQTELDQLEAQWLKHCD
jgi:ATP-binding cassette, subfamily F, member 3